MRKLILLSCTGVVWLALLAGCSPTVTVAPPDKPIVINMNIKIEHDIRIRMDKEVDALIRKDKDIF
ncbi:MAG: YnbE family lipoprotein [Magnetococcales bacterium]|nr:YnbE family lipoprotein [Magnetococcales bacterium]